MRKLLMIAVIGFLFSCSEDNSTNNKISMGAKVFSNTCSSCHDSGMGPNLNFNTLELSDIVHKVTYGESGMPSFRNSLSDKEIEDVAYYIYSLK